MSEVAAAPSFRSTLFLAGASHFKGSQLKQLSTVQRRCDILRTTRKLRLLKIESQVASPSTYSSRISTDIPLYEIPGASFDQYLEDKPRVFTAIFPDKHRSQQLNQVKFLSNLGQFFKFYVLSSPWIFASKILKLWFKADSITKLLCWGGMRLTSLNFWTKNWKFISSEGAT